MSDPGRNIPEPGYCVHADDICDLKAELTALRAESERLRKKLEIHVCRHCSLKQGSAECGGEESCDWFVALAEGEE